MRNLFFSCFFIVVSSHPGISQQTPNQTLNLSFEKTDSKGKVMGCYSSSGQNDYFSFKDDTVKVDGSRSLRLQKDNNSTREGFGVITFSLPASFKGSEVTLKGYIKTEEVQEGYAGLWLRTEAGTQTVDFDNMQQQGVEGTTDWQQYSITVPMNEEVTMVVFGGILTGKGKSWFDKLELLIDNKPVETVAWIAGKTQPGKKEITKSAVKIDSVLSIQQAENLYVLGKVWGFLKYHHPVVVKGETNFDSSLFAVMPAVLGAISNENCNEVLLNWVNQQGDEKKFPEAASPGEDATIRVRPGLEWLSDKKLLSTALSARLSSIYEHRNRGPNYYVRLMQGVGNPVFDKEAVYKTVPAEDDGFRMLALFRYWNMIEYFFPYKYMLKENWSDVLKEFVPEFASKRQPLHYRLTCLRLINRVHDTHANIYNDPLLQEYFGKKATAADFKAIDNKIIFTGYTNDSLALYETLKPGDEIITVNGRKIAERRKEAEPYICASNSAVAERNFIDRFLFRSNDDSLVVTIRRDGKTKNASIKLYASDKLAYRNGDNWRMPMDTLLGNDIGYISLGKISRDSLPGIFRRLEKTKGIVIDIRNYPTEFMPFAMADYIKNSATPFVKFTAGDLKNPGLFSFTPSLKNGPEKISETAVYKGTIILLINEQSQSQAEYTTMALRTASRAIVMGSQTAGADGNISYVPFPGGFSSPFSGIGVFYPDGKETQGIGIVPDVVVLPTQEGIKNRKDEVLEKAKELILKKKGF